MHHRPRPLAIDLFSGAGGLSLGLEQAGFDVVAAVEVDPIHAAVHSYNFPHSTMIAQSVVNLDASKIRQAARIGDREVALVVGGAPCQGFSLIGRRSLDDPRNSLVREFVRLVVELRASYFLFENVKGITVGKHAAFLNELIEEFDRQGYDVVLPWRVLNASQYGVPQDRQRLFLMGGRRGLPLPSYPAPTTQPANATSPDMILPIGPTCGDALRDLPDAERYSGLVHTDSVKAKLKAPSGYAATLRGDAIDYSYNRDWDRGLLTSSLRSDHTELSRERFASTVPGTVEPVSRFFRLSEEGISNTLRAGTDSARGAFTSPRPIHYKYARCITVREMMRLHGYPDWFRMHPTKWHGARQVGNSVPPPLARAVASKIIEALGINPKKPGGRLELGDSNLLNLDMQRASAHFGIEVPIASRVRQYSEELSEDRMAAI